MKSCKNILFLPCDQYFFYFKLQVKLALQGESSLSKEVVGASSFFGGRVPVAKTDALPMVAEFMAPLTGCNKSEAQVTSYLITRLPEQVLVIPLVVPLC